MRDTKMVIVISSEVRGNGLMVGQRGKAEALPKVRQTSLTDFLLAVWKDCEQFERGIKARGSQSRSHICLATYLMVNPTSADCGEKLPLRASFPFATRGLICG